MRATRGRLKTGKLKREIGSLGAWGWELGASNESSAREVPPEKRERVKGDWVPGSSTSPSLRLSVSLSLCLSVSLSLCLSVSLSPCLPVSLSPCLPVSLSLCLSVSLSLRLPVSLSLCLSVSLSLCLSISLSLCLSVQLQKSHHKQHNNNRQQTTALSNTTQHFACHSDAKSLQSLSLSSATKPLRHHKALS